MPYRVDTRGKYKILRAGQEMTALSSGEQLRGALDELMHGGCSHLAVDLSRVVVIDSSVISAIVSVHSRISVLGGELVVLSARNRVLEALLRTSINKVVRIVEHEKDLG